MMVGGAGRCEVAVIGPTVMVSAFGDASGAAAVAGGLGGIAVAMTLGRGGCVSASAGARWIAAPSGEAMGMAGGLLVAVIEPTVTMLGSAAMGLAAASGVIVGVRLTATITLWLAASGVAAAGAGHIGVAVPAKSAGRAPAWA